MSAAPNLGLPTAKRCPRLGQRPDAPTGHELVQVDASDHIRDQSSTTARLRAASGPAATSNQGLAQGGSPEQVPSLRASFPRQCRGTRREFCGPVLSDQALRRRSRDAIAAPAKSRSRGNSAARSPLDDARAKKSAPDAKPLVRMKPDRRGATPGRSTRAPRPAWTSGPGCTGRYGSQPWTFQDRPRWSTEAGHRFPTHPERWAVPSRSQMPSPRPRIRGGEGGEARNWRAPSPRQMTRELRALFKAQDG